MTRKTALIIGAGPAGLTAAYALLTETDIHPVILEESGVIGGISRTVPYQGNRMDLGGHRFFSKHPEVVALWQSLMPLQGAPARDDRRLGRDVPLAPGGPDPEKTDRVMLRRHRVSRIFFLRRFFDYPISLTARTFLNLGAGRTAAAGVGYLAAVLRKRPEQSLEDFYINRFGRPLYRMFFEAYTEKLWGVHPSRIAPDWGAQRIKGLSLAKAILTVLARPFQKGAAAKKIETSLIEEFFYPKLGPGQLWEALAGEILKRGGEIELNTRVTGIRTAGNRVTAVVCEKADIRSERPAEYVFSSMPVKDLVAGLGEGVPAEVKETASALPYRDFIAVGLLVKKLKLQNGARLKTAGNLVPDCWIYIQEKEVKIGRLQIFNNWSPYLVKDPEHTVWLGLEYFCAEGDALWRLPDEALIRFAAGELEKIGLIEAADVLDGVRVAMKKAYPAYLGSYARFPVIRAYLDRFENLFCIGRNGQHRYNNMDHSMLTALAAVRAVKAGTASKEAVWGVNTEEEYHEVKPAS